MKLNKWGTFHSLDKSINLLQSLFVGVIRVCSGRNGAVAESPVVVEFQTAFHGYKSSSALHHKLFGVVSFNKLGFSLCHLMHYFVTCTTSGRFIFSKHSHEKISLNSKIHQQR